MSINLADVAYAKRGEGAHTQYGDGLVPWEQHAEKPVNTPQVTIRDLAHIEGALIRCGDYVTGATATPTVLKLLPFKTSIINAAGGDCIYKLPKATGYDGMEKMILLRTANGHKAIIQDAAGTLANFANTTGFVDGFTLDNDGAYIHLTWDDTTGKWVKYNSTLVGSYH